MYVDVHMCVRDASCMGLYAVRKGNSATVRFLTSDNSEYMHHQLIHRNDRPGPPQGSSGSISLCVPWHFVLTTNFQFLLMSKEIWRG